MRIFIPFILLFFTSCEKYIIPSKNKELEILYTQNQDSYEIGIYKDNKLILGEERCFSYDTCNNFKNITNIKKLNLEKGEYLIIFNSDNINTKNKQGNITLYINNKYYKSIFTLNEQYNSFLAYKIVVLNKVIQIIKIEKFL